jgi:hypothetical protein
MALIQTGIAHQVSFSAWSKIMQELHAQEYDLRKLKYLYSIKTDISHINASPKLYQPFSEFYDQSGHCGFYSST